MEISDEKKYMSMRRFKEFCRKFPFRAVRKGMGLGDSLGALGVAFGGTGGTSLDDLKKQATSLDAGIAVFSRIYNDIITPGMVGSTNVSPPSEVSLNPSIASFTTPRWFANYSGGTINLDPGFYFIWCESRFSVTERLTLKVKSTTNGTVRECPRSSAPYGNYGGYSYVTITPNYQLTSNVVSASGRLIDTFDARRCWFTSTSDLGSSSSLDETGKYSVGDYDYSSPTFMSAFAGSHVEKSASINLVFNRNFSQNGIRDSDTQGYPGAPFAAYAETGRLSYKDTLYIQKLA